jgi:serine/threonine-protein kinase
MQHCNIPPPPIGHAVPPEVEALALALLAKDRTARPQAMADVEQQLLALASPAPVPAGSATPGQRPAVVARSRGRWIALVALGLLAAPVLLLVLGRSQDATLAAPAATPDGTAASAAVRGELSVFPVAQDNAQPPATVVPAPAPAPVEAGAPPVSETPVPDAPKVQSSSTTELKPRKAESRTERGDPLQRLAQAAAACRSKHGGSPLPKVTIDYAVGSDGSVTRAVPDQDSVLGRCLAGAVKRTKFSPGLRLGLQIEL